MYAHWEMDMKFKASTTTSKIELEPGIYTATLEKITAWTDEKKDAKGASLGVFPRLRLIWNVGFDEMGNEIRVSDRVWLPLSSDGSAKLPHEKSALYNRCSALFGDRYEANSADMDLVLPDAYDSAEGLASLPSFDERKEEGFRPVEVRSLKVNGRELIGLECQLELSLSDNGYNNVVVATPLPKKKAIKPVAKAVREEEELPV